MKAKPEKILNEPIKVDKLIPGGQALGTLKNGKKVFFWDALPGELVIQARVMQDKSSYTEAVALEIESPSPYRIKPKDDCFLSTSPWQNMTYDYELKQKSEILAEIFRQHQLDINEIEVLSVQTDGRDFHYRNKMEYALYYQHIDERIYLAFRGRGSHRKIPITQSSLELSAIWLRAQEIVEELNQTKTDVRQIQSLLLRTNQTGKVEGGLYRNHQPRPQFDNLSDFILGHTYSYSPNGFFQINLPVYEMALREIKPWIKTEQVLDLYAGVGTIGLSVARDKDLTLVECDKSAYHELEKNCLHTNANPILSKSETALSYLSHRQTVILDPPRAGIHPALAEKLLEITPPMIVYLSCNPVTQARDAKILSEKYKISKIIPFNFFPRTPHLESLIILEKHD